MSAGDKAADTVTRGVVLSASAYLLWGFLPLYYRELDHVSVFDVLAHRGLWALAFVAFIVTVLGRWSLVWAAVTNRRSLGILAITGVLIASNWGGFIYAVANDLVLDASLGYFINPLMSVALGVVLLGERLNRAQQIAIALAALGVLNEIILLGDVPWIALFLASSFAAYGYLRKTVNVESIDGLFVEMAVLAPLMVGYLFVSGGPLLGFGAVDLLTIALLLGTGPFTAIPLLLFAAGARRVSLATVGILQFIAPSIMFLIAVLHFREPFAFANALTFAGIWLGLAVFAWDALRSR